MADLRRIAHVEDDPDIRDIAALSLRDLGGFDLMQFSSGPAALEGAEAFAPQLFLLDVMMPELNGIETLKALRQNPELERIPAIFMTSVSVADEFDREFRPISIGAIQKPFDPMSLAEEIRAIWSAQ